MCLEVKTKQNSVLCYFLAPKLTFMWPCKNPQKRWIIIQNGRQNQVAIIMYVMELIVTGYKDKTYCDVKEGGMAKVSSSESAMKWKLKILPYSW